MLITKQIEAGKDMVISDRYNIRVDPDLGVSKTDIRRIKFYMEIVYYNRMLFR